MKAYNYNEIFVYVGESECLLDPLEKEINNKEVYLLPANSTFKPTPEYNALTQYLIWNERDWEIKDIEEEKPLTPTPQELRKQAYETLPLIEWEGKEITVDQANKICMSYMIEDNENYLLLKPLIIDAKTHIRELYPDE